VRFRVFVLVTAILLFSLAVFSTPIAFTFDRVYDLYRLSDEPVLVPQGFGFEARSSYNPAAIIVDGEIWLFYRAEDWTGTGRWNGTSRIGLARSTDGLNFHRNEEPVFVPKESYELPGGCEDPRIVKIDGQYIMTYTAYDGSVARLCIAVSDDLINWERFGPIIRTMQWSKAGAIVPQKINDRYYMYFGDTSIYLAYSEDLKNWRVLPRPVMDPRPGQFDSRLVEPGPPPLITEEGILLFYNSADYSNIYRVGAALFDINDPGRLLKRTDSFLLQPELSWEIHGQVPNVVFVEGLVIKDGRLLLYYGAADIYVGVAAIDLK